MLASISIRLIINRSRRKDGSVGRYLSGKEVEKRREESMFQPGLTTSSHDSRILLFLKQRIPSVDLPSYF